MEVDNQTQTPQDLVQEALGKIRQAAKQLIDGMDAEDILMSFPELQKKSSRFCNNRRVYPETDVAPPQHPPAKRRLKRMNHEVTSEERAVIIAEMQGRETDSILYLAKRRELGLRFRLKESQVAQVVAHSRKKVETPGRGIPVHFM